MSPPPAAPSAPPARPSGQTDGTTAMATVVGDAAGGDVSVSESSEIIEQESDCYLKRQREVEDDPDDFN